MGLSTDAGYRHLLEQISETYTQGRVQAVQAINAHITDTYWQVGRDIVEFEQGGKIRADYGRALIVSLAKDLGLRHGKGFSRSNLIYMRLLYLRYPISQKPSHQLSWSHYVELLKLDDELERGFYERQFRRVDIPTGHKSAGHPPIHSSKRKKCEQLSPSLSPWRRLFFYRRHPQPRPGFHQ